MPAIHTVPATVSIPLLVGDFVRFAVDNSASLGELLAQHINIVVQSILVAVPLGVTLGVLITFNDSAATAVLWLTGVIMTVPSIALFGLLIPYFGIGKPPVIVALILYSQLPVVRNTYIGLTQVDEAAIAAGRGLGMTRFQRLWRVRIPKALPVIMAGVRNAVIVLIGIAAIGAFIGAGGLGDYIFRGITDANTAMIVVTTVVLSILALAFDYVFAVMEQTFRLRNGEDDLEELLPIRLARRVAG